MKNKIVRPGKIPRTLSWDEEFKITLLVLDKFLWVGFLIMAFGIYNMLERSVKLGYYYMIIGALILLLFIFGVTFLNDAKRKKLNEI
ncbi:MAG: hypothetical protein GWP09_03040 [Nitrospiraceae bacterium]|nr:hypothetical protein [Nitrospiraceae bacterium]